MPANPVCQQCQGTGWREVERDGLRAVVRCSCVRSVAVEDRVRIAGVPERFRGATFKTFRVGEYLANPLAHRHLTMAAGAALRFAEDYPFGDKKGLLLQGPPGVGKTHLAVAVLHKLMEKGFDGAFFDYHGLLGRIRASFDPTAGSGDRSAYQRALDAEILLLDDLGAHRATDWVYDTVTSVITERYNGDRAIVVTTNLPVEKLGDLKAALDPETERRQFRDTLDERIGERAVSRLLEMCRVITIAGGDYRLRDQRMRG